MNPSDSAPQGALASLRVAAALGFLGVGLGAFGAHGLGGQLEAQMEAGTLDAAAVAERIDWWKTAAFYHLVHAVALLAAGAAAGVTASGVTASGRSTRLITALFALGIIVFSGTLYAMALGAPRWFGAITPIGGVLLLAGWATLFLTARPAKN